MFVGVIDDFENGVARATGYTWIRDQINGSYYRKADERTKILALNSGTIICYQLPDSVDVARLQIIGGSGTADSRVWLSDGGQFKMDISESEYPRLPKREHRL